MKISMRVVLYHKQLTSLLGGGTFQPLTFIAELQKTCDVVLALNEGTDLAAVARMAEVDIDAAKVRVVALDPVRGFVRRHPALLALVRARRLKRLARDADVCISTANVIDFGRPGHHFVYLLSQFGGHAFYDYLMHPRGRLGIRRAYRRLTTALYENVAKPLFGIRPLRKIISDPRERIYPTSKYVEGIVRGFYGPFNSHVFYPPTIFEFGDASVQRDPLLAIYVGRIFAPKHITDLVAMVARARELTGKDLKLHIAGKLTDDPYVAELERLAAARPWLKLVGPVYGKEKEAFMLSATYALHAERDEAFGIAIAEYLKAGCIPVVPDEGGPQEIVESPALAFRTVEDAARTLARLLEDDVFRDAQRRHCAARAKEFTVDAFRARQRALVARILHPANLKHQPSKPKL